MHRAILVLAIVSAACASAPAGPPPREPEPTRARAALATLVVDNQTAERITIVYLHTGRTTTEVAVGSVQPRSRARTAPVPAGEPIVLLARTATGLQLVLPARTFDIDGEWTWTVPANARFQRPGDAEDR